MLFAPNISCTCRFSLEPETLRWGRSNEYLKSISFEKKKLTYTPVNPTNEKKSRVFIERICYGDDTGSLGTMFSENGNTCRFFALCRRKTSFLTSCFFLSNKTLSGKRESNQKENDFLHRELFLFPLRVYPYWQGKQKRLWLNWPLCQCIHSPLSRYELTLIHFHYKWCFIHSHFFHRLSIYFLTKD